MFNSKIIGTGHYVPQTKVSNDDLSQMMDTNDEWIQERTGIQERRWADKALDESATTMAVKASEMAIQKAGLKNEEIDFIVFATLSPDYYFPGGGVQLQHLLGMPTVGALDVRAQCSGFIYAISVADQFIKTGMYKNVLVVGAESQSGLLDKTTRGRNMAVIFGDGAGAAVLTRTEDNSKGVLSTHLHSEGQYAEELALLSPNPSKWVKHFENNEEDLSYYPYMNGPFVFKHAVTRFSEAIVEGLEQNKIEAQDIDLLIPHQANLRISQFVQKKFKLSDDQVFNNIQKYGNTTAASIAIALSEAVEEGKIKEDDLVVLAAFGSGFTWGSVILRW
ncbi:MAG: ketoacyl-ACP synthase III [Flavobacteriales bacterium]|jgi:3-oxoacyl-[acyl-carrier-protein] synthase-3|nr:ketoacyl-ACP synthase III [Flavobacteriales bacterium]